MKRNKDGKITLAMLKGKAITTSVPSISIKFHANAEQLEELYGSDDEQKNEFNEKKLTAATREKGSNSTGNIQDTAEGSPLKYLRLNKRSNSTEVSTISDSSPPSDPWKFFSEIKDKIAKSVEDKFTEIKAKNHEDSSPSKCKTEGKSDKTNRENSNLSDSEDLSESSLSKTCGIVSTTEGAEMASDEESLSLKNDTPTNLKPSPTTPTIRHRFRLLKNTKNGVTTCKEGTVSLSSLTKMYNVNVDDVKQTLPDPNEEVESGVDALADVDMKNVPKTSKMVHSSSLVLSSLEKSIDNIEIDEDGTVIIREVAGTRWGGEREGEESEVKTVFSPTGFVDFRYRVPKEKNNVLLFLLVLTISVLYLLIQRYSVYTAGMIAGIAITCFSYYIMNKISPNPERNVQEKMIPKDIWEVPAIKEYQPMLKYEGWLNEYPNHYDPSTYHLSLTQPVHLKLEGNWLRISNTTMKVPKRAMWNEKEIAKNFKKRRIYNLLGAKVCLLPVGLAKIRHWSKKYPICITIPKDQFEFEDDTLSKDTDDEKDSPLFTKKGSTFHFRKKKTSVSSAQRFSKLFAEQDNFYTDCGDSRSDTSSPIHEEERVLTEGKTQEQEEHNDNHSNPDDSWSNCTVDESPTEIKIYLFGRTDREKEDWFRRLCLACHAQSWNVQTDCMMDSEKAASETLLKESDYALFMSAVLKAFKKRDGQVSTFASNPIETDNVTWLNAFLGRILFDCMCDEVFTSKIKERIQRKLAAIKLPYFIEELSIAELHLGKTMPLFKKISQPVMDDRGLWVDMNMTYKGSAVLTLTTKLNLMKLKQPPTEAEREVQNKSAIFNSDVDDSAESSSEDDSIIFSNISDTAGTNTGPPAAPANKNKKLMKMVDKITESKFFQAATDNKYIKRAMEGVSNTDLRLKVEVRVIEGTLVLNIPPPPTDRIWIGFRPVPELSLSAHPVVGERNISFMYVTDLIEKKLKEEFQKLLVIPNMEDVIIPLMMSKLPN